VHTLQLQLHCWFDQFPRSPRSRRRRLALPSHTCSWAVQLSADRSPAAGVSLAPRRYDALYPLHE